MKNFLMLMLSFSLCSCATHTMDAKTDTPNSNRKPATANFNEIQNTNLTDVISLNSGYWDVKKGSDSYFGRYRAYIIAGNADQDYNTLVVYAEKEGLRQLPDSGSNKMGVKKAKIDKQNNNTKFSLVAKNDKFVWGSDWAGTEPTLTVNKKGSLVINTMNEGMGRSAWNQQVIVRLNPEIPTMEVIGLEFTSFDKLDQSASSCSYNFNTGVGVIKTTSPTIESDGNAMKNPKNFVKNVKVPTEKINLNDWKDSSEIPMLKDCFSI